jgi:Mn2+/Fe2+ NRAMP family transporter
VLAQELDKAHALRALFPRSTTDDDVTDSVVAFERDPRRVLRILRMALVTYPLMAGVQYAGARIGFVTGMGLGGVLARYYPRLLVYLAVVAPISAIILGLQLFGPYRLSARVFKWLTVELSCARWDVGIGMLLSNLVMYFIILAAAATLHATGQTDVRSAADVAQALRPMAGDFAAVLLAAGLALAAVLMGAAGSGLFASWSSLCM